MSIETKEKESHSEEQARLQLGSIFEMVAKLSREGAAKLFVADKDREELLKIAADGEVSPIGYYEDLTDLEELRDVIASEIESESMEPDGFEFDEEKAREEIQEDPLSVQVRGGWYSPGDDKPDPEEFEILLCTGGPAVRIRGELSNGEPDRCWLEHQDWGTSWQQYFPKQDNWHETLLTYCRQFNFGE